MAISMKIDDEIRLKIIESLLKKGSVSPNMRQIKRNTGFHKATIKSSLDFLEKEGVLQGWGPKVNFRKFGYNLEAITMYQMETSERDKFRKLLERVEHDPHLYNISSVIGSGNWNFIARHFYKDVESYHKATQEHYYSMPGIFDLIKDRLIFYATEPVYKSVSRTESIIKIIKQEKGFE
jgi:DNA-binding Lrp family transcriptional regulator